MSRLILAALIIVGCFATPVTAITFCWSDQDSGLWYLDFTSTGPYHMSVAGTYLPGPSFMPTGLPGFLLSGVVQIINREAKVSLEIHPAIRQDIEMSYSYSAYARLQFRLDDLAGTGYSDAFFLSAPELLLTPTTCPP